MRTAHRKHGPTARYQQAQATAAALILHEGAEMLLTGISGVVQDVADMINGAYKGTHSAIAVNIERGVVNVRFTTQALQAVAAEKE